VRSNWRNNARLNGAAKADSARGDFEVGADQSPRPQQGSVGFCRLLFSTPCRWPSRRRHHHPSACAKRRRTLGPSPQASWDRKCPLGDLERSLGCLPVVQAGARPTLSATNAHLVLTDGTLTYSSRVTEIRPSVVQEKRAFPQGTFAVSASLV